MIDEIGRAAGVPVVSDTIQDCTDEGLLGHQYLAGQPVINLLEFLASSHVFGSFILSVLSVLSILYFCPIAKRFRDRNGNHSYSFIR